MLKSIRVPAPIKRLVIGVMVLIVVLALIEIGLRVGTIITEDYYVRLPNEGWRFEPVPGSMPGVDRGGVFSTSPEGLRGDAYNPDPEAIQILTVGGSTTECAYLDQPSTWPELVGTQLGAQTGRDTWVGNAARSALRASESVLITRYLLPQLGEVDYVVAMLGANDMLVFLKKGEKNLINEDLSRGQVDASRMYRTFSLWPNPLEGDLEMLERLQPAESTQAAEQAPDEVQMVGGEYIDWRLTRQNAEVYLNTLPLLDAALATYRLHLVSLIRLAEKNGAKMVFVTQPSIYTEDMPSEIEALLWTGSAESQDGRITYFSADVIRRGYEAYNQELLAVCAEYNVLCVDAASAMNGNPAYFYDDVHLNYAGADKLATLIVAEMVEDISGR